MPRTSKHGAASARPAPGRSSWLPKPAEARPSGRGRAGRVAWADLCRDPELVGRWVALDAVRYEDGVPLDGELVDSDPDLAALCGRVQSADETSCAILFCEPLARRAGLS